MFKSPQNTYYPIFPSPSVANISQAKSFYTYIFVSLRKFSKIEIPLLTSQVQITGLEIRKSDN